MYQNSGITMETYRLTKVFITSNLNMTLKTVWYSARLYLFERKKSENENCSRNLITTEIIYYLIQMNCKWLPQTKEIWNFRLKRRGYDLVHSIWDVHRHQMYIKIEPLEILIPILWSRQRSSTKKEFHFWIGQSKTKLTPISTAQPKEPNTNTHTSSPTQWLHSSGLWFVQLH